MKVSKNDIILRRQMILEFLQEHTYCENTALAEHFHLSIATLRRDIMEMEKEGLIIRYHGGIQIARPLSQNVPYNIYSKRNFDEKTAIVRYLVSNLILDQDVIFVNGSSTALLMYQYLKKDVTVVTNNVKALMTNPGRNIHFILIGGESSSHNGEHIMCGEFALNMISMISASVSILGVSGISVAEGLTSSSPQDISVNKMMLSRTRNKKIIVADHSKIGKAFNFNFAQITDITHLITDSGADSEELRKIEETGVEVIVVDPLRMTRVN